ncbi:MAG: PAS domain S-box protein, partial [Maribacter sp.]
MRTLAVDFLLRESPNAIAIVDTKLNFISYSNEWIQKFTLNSNDITNKHFFDVTVELPETLKTAIINGIKGEKNINTGEKYTLPSGKTLWLKWKILPATFEANEFDGAIIFLDDITVYKKEIELLHKAEEVARIGCWELDLNTGLVNWTKTTKDIHEVDENFKPNLEDGINFYKEGIHRDNITNLVSTAIADLKSFHTELIIITAKGNEIWVAAKGEVEIVNGKAIKIVGTFQDIDERKKIELAHKEITERLKITNQSAKIGTWDYDLIEDKLVWDIEMYRIFDVKKDQFSGVFEAWSST